MKNLCEKPLWKTTATQIHLLNYWILSMTRTTRLKKFSAWFWLLFVLQKHSNCENSPNLSKYLTPLVCFTTFFFHVKTVKTILFIFFFSRKNNISTETYQQKYLRRRRTKRIMLEENIHHKQNAFTTQNDVILFFCVSIFHSTLFDNSYERYRHHCKLSDVCLKFI